MKRLRAGHLLALLGRREEARIAFDRAIAIAGSVSEAAHIRQRLDKLAVDTAS